MTVRPVGAAGPVRSTVAAVASVLPADSRPALSTARTSYRKVWPVAGVASTKDGEVSSDEPPVFAHWVVLSRRHTR
ncbi:hypothetical protein ABZV34_12960 [Streptomyces sp. NPDC005195]|uniref:hypothetical protein n=1 Tax=Streptomyces sp. NPDC005195 TaxID=3154561 RepID=UPI0033B6E3D9